MNKGETPNSNSDGKKTGALETQSPVDGNRIGELLTNKQH